MILVKRNYRSTIKLNLPMRVLSDQAKDETVKFDAFKFFSEKN